VKESIFVPNYKQGDKRDCNNYRGISLLPATYKILFNILLSRLTSCAEDIIAYCQCGSDATGQLLIIYSAFVKYLKKKERNILTKCVTYS